MKDYLNDNYLTKLPIIITNKTSESVDNVADDYWYIKKNSSQDTNYNNIYKVDLGNIKSFDVDSNGHHSITDDNYKSLIKDTHIRGPRNAKYNVVVYSDFEC
jgi:hypothetical protein